MRGKIKQIFQKKQNRIVAKIIVILFFIFILSAVTAGIKKDIPFQNIASKWGNGQDYSQFTCVFVKENSNKKETFGDDSYRQFIYKLTQAYEQDAIGMQKDSEKLILSCYSSIGNLSLSSDYNEKRIKVCGVGGDFFTFHDFELLSGSYFYDDDISKDTVVLDEDAAWELYGSYDIAGKYVYINGDAYIVSGVIRRGEGRFNDAAGNNSAIAYIPYSILSKYSKNLSIENIELVMPEPVKGYGLKLLKENIDVDKSSYELIENTTRYDTLNLLSRIKNFGVNSMVKKPVSYPYWENVARAYEDVLAVIIFIRIILFVILSVYIIRYTVYLVKNKKIARFKESVLYLIRRFFRVS